MHKQWDQGFQFFIIFFTSGKLDDVSSTALSRAIGKVHLHSWCLAEEVSSDGFCYIRGKPCNIINKKSGMRKFIIKSVALQKINHKGSTGCYKTQIFPITAFFKKTTLMFIKLKLFYKRNSSLFFLKPYLKKFAFRNNLSNYLK